MPGPHHLYYELQVFDYLAYPVVLVEIDDFDKAGTHTNCYQYNLTWLSAAAYAEWLTVASSLTVSGTTATRLRRMFDALNHFLRRAEGRGSGVPVASWSIVQKQNGPCLTHLTAYFAFEQVASPWVDNVASALLPWGALTSTPGLIGFALRASGGSIINSNGSNGPVWPGISSPGLSLWGWFQSTNVGAGGGNVQFGFYDGALSTLALFIRVNPGGATALFRLNVGHFTIASATLAVTAGTWVFFAGTYEVATNQAKIYRNGSLASTVTPASPTISTAQHNPFANATGGSAPNSVLWDETGLSMTKVIDATQVTALYNGGAGVTWPAVQTIIG